MSTANKKGVAAKQNPKTSLRLDDSRMAVTLREAAGLLSVSERTIWGLCASGQLRSFTIGRCRRIPTDALRDLMVAELATIDEDDDQLRFVKAEVAS